MSGTVGGVDKWVNEWYRTEWLELGLDKAHVSNTRKLNLIGKVKEEMDSG